MDPHHRIADVATERITDTHWGERGSLVLDWGCVSAYLLRVGPHVYACTFCEPRWFLWRREPDGTWTRGASGPMLRTPLLLAGPDGRLHVISAGVHWQSTEPGGFQHLTARELPAPCGTMIYISAAINTAGDLLLAFVNPDDEHQVMTAHQPAGSTGWDVRELCRLPVRYCYPQLHLVGHTAHVFLVEDELVRDPRAKWGGGSGYYYRFRDLLYAHCADIRQAAWSVPVSIHRQDDGFLHTQDILALPDGSVHLLWWGYDRSAMGAAAPGHRTFLTHSSAPHPGAPFTHHPVAEGTVRTGNFLPDGAGGWHYLYGDAVELRHHPYVGYDQAICRHLYRHRAADGVLGPEQPVDTGDARPSVPHLLRAPRFGGDALPDTLEAIWEDPWAASEGTTCWRHAHYTRIALRAPEP